MVLVMNIYRVSKSYELDTIIHSNYDDLSTDDQDGMLSDLCGPIITASSKKRI